MPEPNNHLNYKNMADVEKINPDNELDVKGAYQDKMVEHAEIMASCWTGDWGKFIDKLCDMTDLSRTDALLYVMLSMQKNACRDLQLMSADIGWLHAHYHGGGGSCPMEKHIKQAQKEDWEE